MDTVTKQHLRWAVLHGACDRLPKVGISVSTIDQEDLLWMDWSGFPSDGLPIWLLSDYGYGYGSDYDYGDGDGDGDGYGSDYDSGSGSGYGYGSGYGHGSGSGYGSGYGSGSGSGSGDGYGSGDGQELPAGLFEDSS